MKTAKFLLVFLAATCFFILLYLGIAALVRIRPNPPHHLTASPTVAAFDPFEDYTGSVDFASADLETLDSLPGIGPSTAKAVRDYIENGGSFHFPEDIMNVKGIGSKKFEELKPYLTFHYPPLPSSSPLFP